MHARHALTLFAVRDLAVAARFYTQAFGWEQIVVARLGRRSRPRRRSGRQRHRGRAGHVGSEPVRTERGSNDP